MIVSLNEEIVALKNASSQKINIEREAVRKKVPVARAEMKVPTVHNTAPDNSKRNPLFAIMQRMKNGESINDINAKAFERFESEEIDDDWAYNYESHIRDIAAADAENNFNIQTVNCKTII